MVSELRKTGIRVIGDLPWGTHICHFYETKQDLFDTLVPYFKTGLESKEFCLWVVSDCDLITVEEAREALALAVPDLDRHLAEENIEILKRHDWYFEKNVLNSEMVTNAWDAKLKQALTRGYAGLRASADTFWLAEKDWKDFCAYEKQVNEWITDQSMTVLCTYPLMKSKAAEVLEVVQAHQFAIARRQGGWEVLESPELIQAKAEIKRMNEELEQRMVDRTGQLARAIEELTVEVSERKQSEVELSLAHQRLSYHVENTPLAVIEWDKDLFIKRWSKRAEEIFGWTASEALGINMYDRNFPVVHEEDKQAVAEISGQLMKGIVNSNQGLNRNYTKDGNVIYCEWYNSVLRDEDGNVITILSLVHDVTESKQAEALLYAKEQEFRAIVKNAPDQIIRYDREFRRTYVNPAVARAYGLPAEALIGKPIGSVIRDAGLDAKDDELAQLRQRIQAVFDAGKSCEFEITWPSPTGRKYYSSRLFPELDLNGSVINVLGIARDITERKRVECAQRESQLQYETLVQSIDGIVWEADPQTFTFTFVSKQAERILGYPLEQWFEGPGFWPDHMHPDDRDWAVAFCVDATARGVDHQFEYRMIAADGRVVWFSDIVTLHAVDNHSVLLRGLMVDITERKLAEEKLRQSENQLSEAQRLAHVGSWNWDLRSDTVTWSDELYRIFGVQPGEIEVAGDARRFIHPEDVDLVWSTIESSVKNKEPYSFYYRVLRPDGAERIVHSRGCIVSDEHGEPIRVFGATQDVTERKEAEEALREAEQKYRDIFENAGEGIFQSTPDGRYIEANPALARMYGFASPEELIQSCQDISRQVYVDPTRRDEFKQQLKEQGALRGFEHEVFRKDGSRLWISVNARAVRDDKGAIQYYEGTVQDITERKAAEEDLKATSELLRALSARLQTAREEEGTRIAREIHDELGSALTGLRWSFDEIASLLSSSVTMTNIDHLRQKIAAMATVIDSTFDTIRRISSELRPSILDDVGLTAAFRWQAQQFEALTGMICNGAASVPTVHLNREQSTAVFRIFQEALTNITRHAQATKVDIEIKEKGGQFVLTISDNGKGIRIEEKSGMETLGLLGMRERAHLIGGEVSITAGETRGTVVTVRVPITGHSRVRGMTR